MGLDLEPYNHWILLGSCIILLLFIVICAVHALRLMKAVHVYDPDFKSIKKNVMLAKIKTEAMKEKKQEDEAKNKPLKILLPILIAIKHSYDADEQLHGVKGYAKAATRVVQKKQDEKKIIDRLSQSIH